MSAALDALDRGVIDAGLTAAQALARVEQLEARVAALEKQTPQARQLEYEAVLNLLDQLAADPP